MRYRKLFRLLGYVRKKKRIHLQKRITGSNPVLSAIVKEKK